MFQKRKFQLDLEFSTIEKMMMMMIIDYLLVPTIIPTNNHQISKLEMQETNTSQLSYC
jgi:hypothetical protein